MNASFASYPPPPCLCSCHAYKSSQITQKQQVITISSQSKSWFKQRKWTMWWYMNKSQLRKDLPQTIRFAYEPWDFAYEPWDLPSHHIPGGFALASNIRLMDLSTTLLPIMTCYATQQQWSSISIASLLNGYCYLHCARSVTTHYCHKLSMEWHWISTPSVCK